jgi:type I restriction enzyme, S subunit
MATDLRQPQPPSPTDAELPEGWVQCQMDDISRVVGGGTPKADDPTNFADDGYPWITPADLSGHDDMYISRGRRSLSEKGLQTSSAVLMPPGSVVFSSRAPIGYVAIANGQVSTNQGCRNFVLEAGVCPEYVYHYLRFAKPIAEQMASGTTFLEISGTNAGRIPIPLPPAAEQARIANKVSELEQTLSHTQQRLVRVPAILKRLR